MVERVGGYIKYLIMDQLYNFFVGNTTTNYVQAGFSNSEAAAMAWIADQKPMGKFYGALAGGFLALTWGHWHHRIMKYFGVKCSKVYSQVFVLAAFITFGDYITCNKRYGANEYWANKLYLNNNLFQANLRSLVDNFEVMNRKFTDEEVRIFNQRAVAMKSNHSLKDRKWIFNPNIETEEEFERRRKLSMTAPWEDLQLKQQIKMENSDKECIIYGPHELSKLIDETGVKLGVVHTWEFGYRPM